jgi:CheY-like chemotaxis protein
MVDPANERRAQAKDARRASRLMEVARSLFVEGDPEVIFERILEGARDLTGARYAALGVLNERRDALVRLYTAGIDEHTRQTIGDAPRGRGVLGLLISDPKPLRLTDVAGDAASYGFPPGHPVMRSFLGVPVHVRGQARGNLYLTDKPGEFDESDEEVALIFADWAATTIELEHRQPPFRRRWRDREQTLTAEPEQVAQEPAGSTLLLVEDEDALRDLVGMVLEEQGYVVLEAANGLDALELAERHRGPIDLLITDVVMPRVSGAELARRLRELRPALEVLFISDYNDSRLKSQGLDEASVNLLAQPFTPQQLSARVRALINNGRS